MNPSTTDSGPQNTPHDDGVQLLTENRERLDSLALFQAETLEWPAAYAAAGSTPPPRRRPSPH
jgi:hypothetical protein